MSSTLGSRFRAEFLGRIVAIAAGGVLTVALARLLGAAEYGLLFFAISVFTALGVLSKLGVAKSTARYVAEYKEHDAGQLPHILRFSLLVNLGLIAIVGIALFLGHTFLANALGEPDLAPFLVLGVLYIAFETLKTYARLILQGFECIEFSASIHAVDQACRLAFAIGFVLLGFGALGALFGYILGFAVATVLGLGGIYVHLYQPRDAAGSIESGLRRRICEYTVPLTATSTANTLDKQVDTILVGFFLTPVAVSYYVIGKQIVEFVETPVTALGFTLSPTFGAEKADGNVDRAARLYEEALRYSLWLYIPVAAGIVLVAEPAIELVFGAAYLGAVPVLQLLSLFAILQAITKLTSNGLDYLGRARERAYAKGITAVLNVGLNLVLIPTMGVVGAALATVVTYSMYTFANVYIIHQEFDLRVGRLLRHVALVASVTVPMVLAVYATVDHITGVLSLVAVVALGVVVWGTLSVLVGLFDPRTVDAIR